MRLTRALCLFTCLQTVCSTSVLRSDDNWPQWRGPEGTGVASTTASPPVEWSDSENIKWKTPIPGRGHGTPVVWGNMVFLTTAVEIGKPLAATFSGRPGAHDNLPVTSEFAFMIFAFDRNTGKKLWKKTLQEAIPVEGAHKSASLASASPVTDGQYVYAFFGSFGLYCLDFEGNLVWEKQLGQMHTKHGHGEGASPVLHEGMLAINWDHEEQSFVTVLDASSGKEIWRKDRTEVTSWSTPAIVEFEGRAQLIVAGTERVRSYDLRTGKVLWECGGMSANIVATPVYKNGIVVVGSSYEKRIMMAIELKGAKGDITGSKKRGLVAFAWYSLRAIHVAFWQRLVFSGSLPKHTHPDRLSNGRGAARSHAFRSVVEYLCFAGFRRWACLHHGSAGHDDGAERRRNSKTTSLERTRRACERLIGHCRHRNIRSIRETSILHCRISNARRLER